LRLRASLRLGLGPGAIRWDIQVLPLLIGRVQVLARHDSMAQPVEISGTFARPRFSAGSIRLPNVSLSRLGSPWSTVQPTASLALSWEPFEIVNGKANGVASIELRDVASALTPVRPAAPVWATWAGSRPRTCPGTGARPRCACESPQWERSSCVRLRTDPG